MSKLTMQPWCLLGADFSDELDGKIRTLAARVSGTEEAIKVLDGKLTALDAKVTACCDDTFKADLRGQLAALRAELSALRPTP
jgi:hypothetical protein